jgi:signal transduction histidine kinase/CHASE3 domain sensor protein
MKQSVRRWWDRLRIQHKVWAVLLLLCVPLGSGVTTHFYLVQQLSTLQQQRHELILAHEAIHTLQRLAIDIEDGFRGYVLTEQATFLTPMTEAELKLDEAVHNASRALSNVSDISGGSEGLAPVKQQLEQLLRSKHGLIADIQRGNAAKALVYVKSGEGLRLSDNLRETLRVIEGRLGQRRSSFNDRTQLISEEMFVGLWITLFGLVVLGWLSSRMLAGSITDPVRRLHRATAALGTHPDVEGIAELLGSNGTSKDELGLLADAYLDMARRIQTHIREIEVLDTIGHEINTIGPDGLEGVLRRITDRAVELVRADVCLVLLRHEQMGCWVVEAASGEWNDRLKKSVMLWEELPVSVRAYETREPAMGEGFRSDDRPEVLRRNVIGDSMLAIPLLSQGAAFGVLALLCENRRPVQEWNQRLAEGLAQEAALAISNARLYETVQEKQRGLRARLRHLEHLAETLAHDLKGPGARMEELATLLAQKFSGQLDERTARWLTLIQENGKDLVRRVEGILEVARVGTGQGSVTAVDPGIVINDVLKARAGQIAQRRAVVHVAGSFPLVASHGAYLRQVFDNLISNALQYARPGQPPELTLASRIEDNWVCFTVADRGIGIPQDQRLRVFQPFVRLMRSDAQGSGIGLAIVQRIVEVHGGHVWIEGDENEGCTVKFTMPCLKTEMMATLSPPQASG